MKNILTLKNSTATVVNALHVTSLGHNDTKIITSAQSITNTTSSMPSSHRIKWAVANYNVMPREELMDGCPGTFLDEYDCGRITENDLYSISVSQCCFKTFSATFHPIMGGLMCAYTCIASPCLLSGACRGPSETCCSLGALTDYGYPMYRSASLLLNVPFFKTACQTAMCCCGYCAGAVKDATCNDSTKPTNPVLTR